MTAVVRYPLSINLPRHSPPRLEQLRRSNTAPPAAPADEPHSPSSPTSPTPTSDAHRYLPFPSSSYFPSSSSAVPEPWKARLDNARKSHRPSTSTTTTPETLSDLLSYSTNSSTSPQESTMATAGSMKRKVVVLGAPSVGKTSLTQQYVTPPTYNEAYFPTIEATSHKSVTYNGVEYECEIVDSAGQDEYTLFPAKYAVGIHGYMLVYSIASRQSFEMIQTVHDKILDLSGQDTVPCVVVGQKCDLASERRVTTAEGEALAKSLNAIFIESSARDNKNVGKAFDALLGEMQRVYNPAPEKKKKGWFGW